MSESQTIIEGWAILELFGHYKLAGYVRTAIIGTSGMFRVDVPETGKTAPFTRFYGPGAIYSLTLVTEEIARAALPNCYPEPVMVYIPKQLPEKQTIVGGDDYQYEDDDSSF